MTKPPAAWKAGWVLAGYDDAFRRIDVLISRLRLILSADMLRILGHRLIQAAEEMEPAPPLQGSVYGWQYSRLAVRDPDSFRTVRLMAELDADDYDEREIVDELVHAQMRNRGGRIEWRSDRLRVILSRERGRRSLPVGIDAPGSPFEKSPNVANVLPETTGE